MQKTAYPKGGVEGRTPRYVKHTASLPLHAHHVPQTKCGQMLHTCFVGIPPTHHGVAPCADTTLGAGKDLGAKRFIGAVGHKKQLPPSHVVLRPSTVSLLRRQLTCTAGHGCDVTSACA